MKALNKFLAELRRRKVYHVAVAYIAVAWVVVQAADVLFPGLGIPEWAFRLVVVLALLGFPLALVLAWAFEMTPEGVRATHPAGRRAGGEDSKGGDAPASAVEGPGILRVGVLLTVAVAAALGAAWWMSGRDDGAGMSERSLAVLPFNAIGLEEPGPFAEGIHDDLLTRLSSVGELHVIARTSVNRYRNTDKTASEIARELGVRWVLEGGVQTTSERIKVNVQLVDPRTDTHAWAESYLRELTAESIFFIQSDITRRIAEALQTRLSPREMRSVTGRPTDELKAYELSIRAQTLVRQLQEPLLRQGLQLYRESVSLDPDYAPAWVGIATAFYLLVDYGYVPLEEALPAAREAAATALALDPDLAEAHSTNAMIHHLQQEGPETLRGLGRAIQLRPGYAVAHNQRAWVSQLLGRPELAYESALRAHELDPLAPEPRVNLALTSLILGRPEDALAAARDTSEIQPDWPTARFYEGVILHHMGHHEDAITVMEGLEIPWAGAGPRATLALAHAASGRPERARGLLAELEEGGAHPFLIGLVLAALGEKEAGFEAFRRIERWEASDRWPILAARYLFPHELGAIRNDPRFGELLRRLDLAWGMQKEPGAVTATQPVAR